MKIQILVPESEKSVTNPSIFHPLLLMKEFTGHIQGWIC